MEVDNAPVLGEAVCACLALVLANYTLPRRLTHLWARSRLRVAADGGANRLYDQIPSFAPELSPEEVRRPGGTVGWAAWMLTADVSQARARFVPHLIAGDLDSVRPEVLEFYRKHGAEVVDASGDQVGRPSQVRLPQVAHRASLRPPQDTTDLHKCVALAVSSASATSSLSSLRVVVLGALAGGRLDHQLAALSLLHTFRALRLTLVDECATATLLRPGRTVIRLVEGAEGPVCGLVPLAGPAKVTSVGLRFELTDTRLEMGGLVSTSNTVVGREVVIITDAPLLWTTELRD